MPSQHAPYTVNGQTAFLTFNRPAVRNAMTWDMYAALVEACDLADTDAAVRVLVLRGAGGAFISGTDIEQFTSLTTREDALAYERRIDEVIDRLERMGKPTIAQIQGPATGGGLVIALGCDLRVATPDSRFGIPVARTLGNCLSAANYARLLDLIGPARVKDLMFTGRLMTAEEARVLGLVTRLADAASLDATVAELAATISSNAPLTIRATKEAVRRIQEARRLAAGAADDLVTLCYGSDDFHEGVAAFLAKRTPKFVGH